MLRSLLCLLIGLSASAASAQTDRLTLRAAGNTVGHSGGHTGAKTVQSPVQKIEQSAGHVPIKLTGTKDVPHGSTVRARTTTTVAASGPAVEATSRETDTSGPGTPKQDLPARAVEPPDAEAERLVQTGAWLALSGTDPDRGTPSAADIDPPEGSLYREQLFLKNGDRYSGISRSVTDDRLLFELPHGQQLDVPLTEIDRLEYVDVRTGDLLGSEGPAKGDTAATESASVASGNPAGLPTPMISADQPPLPDGQAIGPDGLPIEEFPWRKRMWRLWQKHLVEWTKRVGLGFRFVGGNAEETNVDLSANFEQRREDRFTQINLGGQYGSSNGVRGTNRWFANSTTDSEMTEKWIWFLNINDEYNERQNLDYRGMLSTGPGYRFFDDDKRRFILRAGPAVTYEIFHEPSSRRVNPELFSEMELKWPLSDAIQLEHRMSVNMSLQDVSFVRSTSNSGLMWALDTEKRWSFRIGFQYQFVSRPNPGRIPNDYWTTLQLVYQRK